MYQYIHARGKVSAAYSMTRRPGDLCMHAHAACEQHAHSHGALHIVFTMHFAGLQRTAAATTTDFAWMSRSTSRCPASHASPTGLDRLAQTWLQSWVPFAFVEVLALSRKKLLIPLSSALSTNAMYFVRVSSLPLFLNSMCGVAWSSVDFSKSMGMSMGCSIYMRTHTHMHAHTHTYQSQTGCGPKR